MIRPLLASISLFAFVGAAHAQSVYLDSLGAKPTSTYAGMASAPGVWDTMFSNDHVGIYGQPIPLDVDFTEDQFSCDFGHCETLASSDATALLSGWINTDCFPSTRIRFRNLEHGTYRIHLYGYSNSACSGGTIFNMGWSIDVTTGGPFGSMPIAPWSGSFATSNHVETTYTYTSTNDLLLQLGSPGLTGLGGIQFEKLAPAPTEYCFGTQGNCPCGPGAAGRGCPTSYDANGSHLSATGESDTAADTLTLQADGVTDSFMTIVQGLGITNQGVGNVFGDGKLCVGGSLLRLKRKLGSSGALTYPGTGETAISTLGFCAPGDTRTYQVWFRDSPTFCTVGAFNLTNAVAVVWR